MLEILQGRVILGLSLPITIYLNIRFYINKLSPSGLHRASINIFENNKGVWIIQYSSKCGLYSSKCELYSSKISTVFNKISLLVKVCHYVKSTNSKLIKTTKSIKSFFIENMQRSLVLVFVLVSVSLCFGYRIHSNNKTILHEHKRIDGRLYRDVTVKGGTVNEDGSILNGVIVRGEYPVPKIRSNGKRSNNVVTFCTNSNMGGDCITMTDSSTVYSTMPTGFSNSISSLEVLDPNYAVFIFTETDAGGLCWTFCAAAAVNNLEDYDLNDQINSVTFASNPGDTSTVTLYQDHDLEGGNLIRRPG